MSDKDKLEVFESGATCGSVANEPYWLNTGHGERVTALRSGYGNEKHEDSRTVISTMNWLIAFHERDLKFFRSRYVHAHRHLANEMKGRFDKGPGGNLGAVGWFVDRMAFVRENDYEFYLAIVGLNPHPGKRTVNCECEYCNARHSNLCPVGPELPKAVSEERIQKYLDVKPEARICSLCNTIVRGNDRHACMPEWCGQTPNLCPPLQ